MTHDSRKQDTAAATETPLRADPAGGVSTDDVSTEPAEASPTGLQVADSWTEAADQTGTVKATRRMPEPDSLGG